MNDKTERKIRRAICNIGIILAGLVAFALTVIVLNMIFG